MQDQHKDAVDKVKILERKLESILLKRSAYIRKWGNDKENGGPFTEEDLDKALEDLAMDEVRIKQDLTEFELMADSRIDDLES